MYNDLIASNRDFDLRLNFYFTRAKDIFRNRALPENGSLSCWIDRVYTEGTVFTKPALDKRIFNLLSRREVCTKEKGDEACEEQGGEEGQQRHPHHAN